MNKNFQFVDPADIGMMTPPRQLPFCSSSRSSSVSSTVNTPLFYEDTSASNDPYSTPFVQQRNKRKRIRGRKRRRRIMTMTMRKIKNTKGRSRSIRK